MPRRVAALVTLALALALAPAVASEFFEGRVVAVYDGDTIEVLVGHERHRVRLARIDTPERGQPWAERSKQALAKRVFGKEVRVNEVAIDRYGRTVGEVYADNQCVGCELVRDGHAWVYRKFTDDAVLLELEAEARAARRGLWSLPEAERIPPWEWRHPDLSSASKPGASAQPLRSAQVFECDPGKTCAAMTSCAEARFHLDRCGASGLDGDRDGVPCEGLCP
jgi:endonuclease YncB( thermonuclease family)